MTDTLGRSRPPPPPPSSGPPPARPAASRFRFPDRLAWRRLAWVAVTAETALAVFLAATPWLRAYHVTHTGAAIAIAAGVSVLIPVGVGVIGRANPLLSYVASLVACVATLLALVSASPTELVRGLTQGPSHLFTDTLPLISPRWFLVPPVLVTWLCGAVTAELTVRSPRPWAPLLVILATWAGAYAACTAAPGHDTAIGAGLFAVLAAILITRRSATDVREIRARVVSGERLPPRLPSRFLGGAAVVAILAVVSAVAVPDLPGMSEPQQEVSRAAPTDHALAEDPVDAIAALRDDAPTRKPIAELTVATNGPTNGYLAVATLDQYDGDEWTFDHGFVPSGGRVPPAPAGFPPTSGLRVIERIDLADTFGVPQPFVPYVDRPVRVAGLAVDADPESGMVLPASAPRLPVTYSVTSESDPEVLSAIPSASPIAPMSSEIDRELPSGALTDLTGTLRSLAGLTGQRPAPTVAFLQAVLAAMRKDDRRVDPEDDTAGSNPAPTRGGTSLAEVINAIGVNQEATPEQFATLFVVVARALGVPARLVTGFRIQSPSQGEVGPGRYQLTNRQAWTWAEIPVAGVGWVVADPTPDRTGKDQSQVSTGAQTATTTTTVPTQPNAVPVNGTGGHAVAPKVTVHVPHHTRVSRWPWYIGGGAAVVVLLVAAMFALAAGRRRLRRHWHRGRTPATSAVGAWLEVLDLLERVGVTVSRSATPSEVAAAAFARFGPDAAAAIARVGRLADQALYAADVPLAPADAAEAWRGRRSLAGQLWVELSRKERIRASLAVGHAPRFPSAASKKRPTSARPPMAGSVR